MFSSLEKEIIPDEKLMEVGRPLVETVKEQLKMATASGDFERKLPDCLKSGYLMGYISGLSATFGALACTDNNIKKEKVGTNVQHLYDFVIYNAFGQDQFDNYKGFLAAFIATQPPAFQRGQFDGKFDSDSWLKNGEFSTCLAGRLTTSKDPRDDLFVMPFAELDELAMGGESDAQFQMASRYSNGRGVEKSGERAVFLYCLAALGGHSNARLCFRALARHLTPEQLNRVREIVESFEYQADAKNVRSAINEIFSTCG